MTIPLPQALSEAISDEVLTEALDVSVYRHRTDPPGDNLPAMRDVLMHALLPVLAALDASATTARETPEPPPLWQHAVNECNAAHVSLDKRGAPATKMVRKREGQGEHPITLGLAERIAALPSPPPAAPPVFEDDNAVIDSLAKALGVTSAALVEHAYESVGYPHAQRRAETPTLAPHAYGCRCHDCIAHTFQPVAAPSPAPPEGPRDAAPELFAAGWRSGYNDGFIHCCEMNEKQRPIKVPSVQDAWQRHNLPEPEVIPRPVSADGAPGGEP